MWAREKREREREGGGVEKWWDMVIVLVADIDSEVRLTLHLAKIQLCAPVWATHWQDDHSLQLTSPSIPDNWVFLRSPFGCVLAHSGTSMLSFPRTFGALLTSKQACTQMTFQRGRRNKCLLWISWLSTDSSFTTVKIRREWEKKGQERESNMKLLQTRGKNANAHPGIKPGVLSKRSWCSKQTNAYHWAIGTGDVTGQFVQGLCLFCPHFTTKASFEAHWRTRFAWGTNHGHHCAPRTAWNASLSLRTSV